MTIRSDFLILRASLTEALVWLGRALSRRRLAALDARVLDDIGVSDAQRRCECALWCWQGRARTPRIPATNAAGMPRPADRR